MAGWSVALDGMKIMENVPADFTNLEHLLPKPGEMIGKTVKWVGKGITDEGLGHLLRSESGLGSVESVDLGHNLLTNNGLKVMGEAATQGRFNPQKLDLDLNGLNGIPDGAQNLTNLQHLNIWGNTRFFGDGIEHLPRSVTTLHLGNTAIGEPAMRQLPKLTNLQELDLSLIDRGQMTDHAWAHLRDLPNLRTLFAGGAFRSSTFSDTAAQHISGLPIERLRVGNSQLTGIGLNDYIAKIPTLRDLSIGHYQGYGIKPGDVATFRQQRPDVNLTYAFEKTS